MSRFRKLSQSLWHCQYHIVFVAKYRLRILTGGNVAREVDRCIRASAEQQHFEFIELNAQIGHVHSLARIPHKESISNFGQGVIVWIRWDSMKIKSKSM